MTLPANAQLALAQPGAIVLSWVEIEGLPYAYGNRPFAASFWAVLPLADRFEALRPYMLELPAGVDSELDPLEGMASPGDFEFRVVDADGTLLQAANVGRAQDDPDALWLSVDLAAGAGTVSVGGNLAAWPAAGTAYIGRETVTYTGKGAGTLTGVTRGRYRSPNVDHGRGQTVTQYPQHLGLRRAWWYLVVAQSSAGLVVGDRIARYAGLLEEYELEKLVTWVLKIRTPEKELGGDRELFRGLISGSLASPLPRSA